MLGTLTDLILGDFLPYIIAAVTAVGGVLFYGRGQRKRGRKEVEAERREADRLEAKQTREKIDAIDRDADPLERLRAKGRLRD